MTSVSHPILLLPSVAVDFSQVKEKDMNTKRCGIDRISSLPDEILTYILSFLSTRNAVQTCILSKRWINTWASVPALEFEIKEFESPKIVPSKMVATKFELFVKNVLEKRDTSCVINRFRLWLVCCGVYLPCTQDVADCIGDAMKLEPRECSIKLQSLAILNLHTNLIFNCASLIDLQLWAFINVVPHVAIEPNSINLPCLKTLNLTARVSDDFFKKLFLGCPVLEELVLSCSIGIIEICSNTLKKLVIRNLYKGNTLQISTPNLLHFEIHIMDIINMGQILLLNMPSLVDAFLSIPVWYDENDYITGVPKLLASFSNLGSLKLKFGCIDKKVLQKELSNFPVFSNLKCLQLVSLRFYVFDLASFFLHHSPKLQELTLQNICARTGAWVVTPEGPSDTLLQWEFLKTVRIVGFENDNGFVDHLINKLFVHVKIIDEIMRV